MQYLIYRDSFHNQSLMRDTINRYLQYIIYQSATQPTELICEEISYLKHSFVTIVLLVANLPQD
jgi:hypothetical protein